MDTTPLRVAHPVFSVVRRLVHVFIHLSFPDDSRTSWRRTADQCGSAGNGSAGNGSARVDGTCNGRTDVSDDCQQSSDAGRGDAADHVACV